MRHSHRNHSPRTVHVLLVASVALLLGACGFQLRGSQSLAPELSRINLTAPVQMQRNLRRTLSAMGVQVSPMNESLPEAFSLQVENTESDARTVSFDRNVDAAEIELRREIEFRLSAPDGTVVLGPNRIDVERIYVHNRDRLLGETGERELLDREMEDEAAQRIIRQLRTLTSEQIRARIEAASEAAS